MNAKRERFLRLAEARTNKIISMIKLLANCSNTSAYEYESDEVRKIFSTLDKELKAARVQFENKHKDKFSLVD